MDADFNTTLIEGYCIYPDGKGGTCLKPHRLHGKENHFFTASEIVCSRTVCLECGSVRGNPHGLLCSFFKCGCGGDHRPVPIPASAPRDHAELITELLEYAKANTDEPAMFDEAGASLMREAAAALSELSR